MNETLRSDGAAREFVRRQVGCGSLILDTQLDLGHQQRALNRRSKARHEEGVIAARVGERHRSACIAAEAIGHQPFKAGGAVPIPASLSAEDQKRDPQFRTWNRALANNITTLKISTTPSPKTCDD